MHLKMGREEELWRVKIRMWSTPHVMNTIVVSWTWTNLVWSLSSSVCRHYCRSWMAFVLAVCVDSLWCQSSVLFSHSPLLSRRRRRPSYRSYTSHHHHPSILRDTETFDCTRKYIDTFLLCSGEEVATCVYKISDVHRNVFSHSLTLDSQWVYWSGSGDRKMCERSVSGYMSRGILGGG